MHVREEHLTALLHVNSDCGLFSAFPFGDQAAGGSGCSAAQWSISPAKTALWLFDLWFLFLWRTKWNFWIGFFPIFLVLFSVDWITIPHPESQIRKDNQQAGQIHLCSVVVQCSVVSFSDVKWIPHSGAARIYMSLFWLTALVLTATYTANLVATLATKKPVVPYRTLDDVAEDNGLTLLIRPRSIQRVVLEVDFAFHVHSHHTCLSQKC